MDALSQSDHDAGIGASRPVRLEQADPPALRPAIAGVQQMSSRGLDAEMRQDLLDEFLSFRTIITAKHQEILHSFDLLTQKMKAAPCDADSKPGSRSVSISIPPSQVLPAASTLGSHAREVRPDPPASPPSKLRVKAPARKSKTTSALSAPEDDMPKRKTSVRSAEEPVSVKMAVVQHKGSEKGSADSVGLPGQLPEALADMKSDEEDTNFDAVVPARNARRAKTAKQHLPTLSAKRRTSWLIRSQRVSPQQDRNAPVKLSRDEKAEAKKAGELAHGGGGLLANFHAEYSPTLVLKNAAVGHSSDLAQHRVKNRCATIVVNPWFERLALTMVILNAVEMAMDVELNRNLFGYLSGASPVFAVTQNVFCVFFLTELVLRYLGHGGLRQSFQDAWLCFETLLTLLMILETWVLPALEALQFTSLSATAANTASSLRFARVLRVLRTVRLARLVKFMPELMILIKGMMVACRSVFFTLLLLLILTVIFGINFMEFSRGTALEALYFDTLWNTVGTLILHCILPDQEVFFRSVATENEPLAGLVLLFILLGSFTVMNMLLGVLVEAVKTVTLIERENLDAEVARKVLWNMLDKDGSEDDERLITRQEFENLLSKKKAAKALVSIGVDVMAAADIGKLLFEEDEAILFLDFMSAMLTLRGSNKTTVKDIVELRKWVAEEFLKVHSLVGELCGFLAEHLEPLEPAEPPQDSLRRDVTADLE